VSSYDFYLISSTVPPSLVSVGPSEMIVTVGDDIMLDCEAVGSPHPMIQWRKDLRKIDFFDSESRYLRQESGNLFIPGVQVEDTGR